MHQEAQVAIQVTGKIRFLKAHLPPCFIWEAGRSGSGHQKRIRHKRNKSSWHKFCWEWAGLQGSSLGMSPGKEAAPEQEMPEKWLMPLLSSWRDVKRRYLGNDQWSNLLWMALHVKIIFSNSTRGRTFSPFLLFHESFKMDSSPTGK